MKKSKIKKICMVSLIPFLFNLIPTSIAKAETYTLGLTSIMEGWYSFAITPYAEISSYDGPGGVDNCLVSVDFGPFAFKRNEGALASKSGLHYFEGKSNDNRDVEIRRVRGYWIDEAPPTATVKFSPEEAMTKYVKGDIILDEVLAVDGGLENGGDFPDMSGIYNIIVDIEGRSNTFTNPSYRTIRLHTGIWEKYRGITEEGRYHGVDVYSKSFTVNNQKLFTASDPDGEKTVTITVSDYAGRRVKLKRKVYLDNTPPNVSLSQNGSKVEISATDVTSGIDHLEVWDGKGSWLPLNGTEYPIGKYTKYYFRAYDKAGNVKQEGITVTPTLDLSYTQSPTTWTNEDVSLKIRGESSFIINKYIDTSGTVNINNSSDLSKTEKITKNGDYKVTATNITGQTKTLDIPIRNIDKTPPTLIGATDSVSTNGKPINIKVTANDPLDSFGVASGNVSFLVRINGKFQSSGYKEFNYTNSTLGTTLITLIASDDAGNVTEKTFSSTIEKPIINEGDITQSPTDWTNKNVTISYDFSTTSDNGFAKVAEPNYIYNYAPKEVASLWQCFDVTKNGDYTVTGEVYNNDLTTGLPPIAGTISKTQKVRNIDKTSPTLIGADDYIQNTKIEEAGTAKTIKVTANDPSDSFGVYSGNKKLELYETTGGGNVLLKSNTSQGTQNTTVEYVNSKEGRRSFKIVATDRAGNKTVKTFNHDIKPKNEILALANTYRVENLTHISKDVVKGPVSESLPILTGVIGSMKVQTKGAFIVEVSFYKGNMPINGIIVTSKTSQLVNYNAGMAKYTSVQNGDNKADNKVSLKIDNPYEYPYKDTTVEFDFILPNIGTNNVEKGSVISMKVVAYNEMSNKITNELGANFFVIKGDARRDLNINAIR